MEIKGLIIFKYAYLKYNAVGTPKKVLIVAPHVFQGTKAEVTVPPSSRHLERFLGASLLSSKACLYILPGSIIERYWSAAIIFMNMQLNIVTATSDPVP